MDDPLEIVRHRLRAQRLTAEPLSSAADVVSWLGAVQSQEFAEAKWSVAERMAGEPSDADVEEAFARGEILRTHVLRPTWHFVSPADIRWMLELTAPRVHTANRYWYGQHDLDEALLERGSDVIAGALAPGDPLTRNELAAILAEAGIVAAGPRLAHIVMYAELEAVICSGPRRGKQHTYVLLDDRAPERRDLSREEALAELTLRYFRGHGPATLKDFSWWSGLKLADARAGVEAAGDRLEREEDDCGRPWFAAPGDERESPADGGGAFLIPMYDELGVAFQDLRMVYAEPPPRDGLMARPIIVDGLCVGSWRRTLSSRGVTIEATHFPRSTPAMRRALDAVAERFGRFLELPVSVELLAA